LGGNSSRNLALSANDAVPTSIQVKIVVHPGEHINHCRRALINWRPSFAPVVVCTQYIADPPHRHFLESGTFLPSTMIPRGQGRADSLLLCSSGRSIPASSSSRANGWVVTAHTVSTLSKTQPPAFHDANNEHDCLHARCISILGLIP
jgi:hypothetical protein